MIYQLDKIVRDVRIAMDENKMSEQLIADEDIDTLSLEEIIRSKIVEAVRRVITIAPVHLLEEGNALADAVFWGDKGSGWILLPDDFLRLVVLKMSDWERPVYEVITAADPLYQLQHSRYKGLRGNVQKPVVVFVNRQEGKALEFYSCNSQAAYMQQGLYVPQPSLDADGGIDISERCYDAAIYMAASLVFLTIGDAEKSRAMSELSLSILK